MAITGLDATMSMPTLESERLILRGFRQSDASAVQRLAGAFEIADTTLTIPHPYEDGVAENWIAGHQDAFAKGRGVTFAMTLKSDCSLVGAMSLMCVEAGHQAELGYWVGVPYWGHGFCTEAGGLVVEYAFSELNLVRIYARHLVRNPSSGRVLRKIGFTLEATRRKHVEKWAVLEDVADYGLLSGGGS
ncbi:MAG: GNAT family N-acetyltransferase [Gammaproteobacteria bacterium]|nr:GNAT family N-acetyltransferase [Gammaproteobacteria bacterium]